MAAIAGLAMTVFFTSGWTGADGGTTMSFVRVGRVGRLLDWILTAGVFGVDEEGGMGWFKGLLDDVVTTLWRSWALACWGAPRKNETAISVYNAAFFRSIKTYPPISPKAKAFGSEARIRNFSLEKQLGENGDRLRLKTAREFS